MGNIVSISSIAARASARSATRRTIETWFAETSGKSSRATANCGLRQTQRYEVCYAADRHTALEKLDDTVDVILYDRRLLRVSDNEVVTEIHERNLKCRVVLLTDSESPVGSEARGFDAAL